MGKKSLLDDIFRRGTIKCLKIFLLILISDYYFVAWLMLAKTPYTIDLLASWSDSYQLSTLVGDVKDRVNTKTFSYPFELGSSSPSSLRCWLGLCVMLLGKAVSSRSASLTPRCILRDTGKLSKQSNEILRSYAYNLSWMSWHTI